MMQVVIPRSWKEEFALAAAVKREDILHREKMARFEAVSRQRIDEARIKQKQREQDLAALEAAFAPPARIVEFRQQIYTYDTKTVEALMDNQEAMERVSKTLDDMLGKAQVLPDGRRVFKTTDGQNVFDEHGKKSLGLMSSIRRALMTKGRSGKPIATVALRSFASCKSESSFTNIKPNSTRPATVWIMAKSPTAN